MKLDLVRLVSSDWDGIGNKGNAMLDLIYTYLIQKNGLDYYRHIKINQISDESLVGIFIEKDKVHINFMYTVSPEFPSYTEQQKNTIRLTIIHEALMLFSEKDTRFSKEKLEEIRKEVLEKAFVFEIDYISRSSPDNSVSANVSINPSPDYFDFYVILRKDSNELYRANIFRGKPTDYYIDMLFSESRWISNDEFVITGPEKQAKFQLRLSNFELVFGNLTKFDKPPLWEMMKFQQSKEEDRNAYENWLHSLPLEYEAILRRSEN